MCVFCFLMALFKIFLNFPLFQNFHSTLFQQDMNFKHKNVGFVKAVFFIFVNLCLKSTKNWSCRVP